MTENPFDDIPGTTVFDARQSRLGFHLNQFCMSLMKAPNRERFLAKLGATHGKSFQQMAGSMTGMTEEEYRDMMIRGGRSAEGNRVLGEHGDAQPHRQPQGASGKAR